MSYVHPAVLRPHDVERLPTYVERQRIADTMGDAIGEPEACGERSGGADVRFGEIDHGDAAAELGGQGASRPAQSAAHVEHAGAGLETGQARQPLGRGLATAVELVGRRQIVDRQRIDAPAGRGERIENPALEPVAAPVGVRRVRIAPAHVLASPPAS